MSEKIPWIGQRVSGGWLDIWLSERIIKLLNMVTNTRLLFKILLKRFHVDCVLDIGSCDGYESLMFRQILPKAKIIAFEANPFQYEKMAADPELASNGIEVLPYAVSNKSGTAPFHVTDLDYADAQGKNPGTSSLFVREGLKIQEIVEVSTRRIDEFLLARYPEVRSVALWIDTEGAEFDVLEGMIGVKDHVVAVHVETARTPMRVGQKVYSELERLMKSLGFVPIGTNMAEADIWGDVVFVEEKRLAKLGFRFHLCRWVGELSSWCSAHSVGPFLRKRCNSLYRLSRRIYFKLFT